MSPRSRPSGCASVLVVCLASASARGAPAPTPARPDVAVVQPAGGDRVLVEASARLRLELGASGLTSAFVESAGDAPTHVAFVREDGVATIDVVATRPDGSPLHRRIRVTRDDGGDDASVLAVRAVEALRGIRLEVRPAPLEMASPPALTPPEPDDGDPPRTEPQAWRVAAGVSALEARPYTAARAFAPSLGVAATFFVPHVSLVATVAGPFFTDRPPTIGGSARTHEELGLVGFRLETRRLRVNLHGALTSGLHHLGATYDTRGMPPGPPTQLHLVSPRSVWTPILAVGAGASGRVWRRLGLTFELTALIAQPAIELVANERSLGTIGGPSLMQTLWAWVEFP